MYLKKHLNYPPANGGSKAISSLFLKETLSKIISLFKAILKSISLILGNVLKRYDFNSVTLFMLFNSMKYLLKFQKKVF